MKRRIVTVIMAAALCLSMPVTTLASGLPEPAGDAVVTEEPSAEDPAEEALEVQEPEEEEGLLSEDGELDEQVTDEQVPDEETGNEESQPGENKVEEILTGGGQKYLSEKSSDDTSVDPALDEQNPEDNDADREWTAEDFTYCEMEQRMNGCDYTRDFLIQGTAVAGFSDAGLKKLESDKDLVIPAQDPNGTTIVGIANNAFKKQGIESLTLPEGMMVDYDDTVTHVVTRRGNFLIGSGAFDGNNLTSLELPEGVIFIGPTSFARNKISYLKIPHTFWWLENSAFAYNNLTTVDFPETCDFQAQIHAFAFAHNNIKSVRLPDYMEVVEKKSFYWNPGMEECPKDAPEDEQGFGGVVYMYTDNENLFNMERIHHIDRTAESQHSWHQKLVLGEDPNKQAVWNVSDFVIEGTKITGLSESGIEKRKETRNLVLPNKNAAGEWITELADAVNSYGLFAAENEGFESVKLPAKIKRIGNRAFVENGISSVEFPATLQEIGLAAFQNNKLVTIILPDSITTLGGGAFGTNPTIEKISLSKGLTEIAAGAFGCSDANNYMTNLTEITIPEGITKIGNNAFAGNNFREIVIPSSVKEIGNYAFSTKEYLTGETTLVLSEGLEKIGTYAFRNKTIRDVDLPTTVTSIKANAFSKVYSSGEAVVKTRLFITNEAQYQAVGSTNFPKSEFHRYVWKGPNYDKEWNAEDFTYAEQTQDMYPASAYGSADAKVEVKGIYVTGFSAEGEKKLETNTDLVIPEKDYDGNQIVGVGTGAFYQKGLTSVVFPKGVMTDYTGKAEYIAEGVTTRGNFAILSRAFGKNNLTSVDLPEGVIYVGGTAFSGNMLTRVSMSHTIWQIANQGFGTNQIEEVVFPETCDFNLNIDSGAFGRNKIRALRLPDRTEKVTSGAFVANTGMEASPTNNSGLVYLYNENVDLKTKGMIDHESGGSKRCNYVRILNEKMPDTLSPWNTEHFAFTETTITGFSDAGKAKIEAEYGYTNVTLPSVNAAGEEVTAIGNNAFAATNMTSVTIPDSVKSIGTAAFRATKLTQVKLPDSVETLGSGAFTTCTELRTVTLSKNLKEIAQSAFNGTAITGVKIPEGVTTVGRMAFAGAPLTSLTLPSTLVTIEQRAFSGHQLAEIDIPASVEVIGQSAFTQNVEGLEAKLAKVTLHEGLKEIASNAFEKSLLTEVNLPGTVSKLAADAFNAGQNGQIKIFSPNKAHLTETADFIPESTGHKVYFEQIAGSGWSYADFTYEGSKITGYSEKGNETRLKNHDLVIPNYNPNTMEAITEVGDGAFKIPDGEWEQKKESVDSPNGMDTVAFPDTLIVIGENAFRYNNFKTLDFPASLTTIKASAFNSNKLEAVVLPDTVTEVQGGAFSTNNITSIKISRGLTTLAQGVFSMNIRLAQVEIPDTIQVIDEMAFAGARLETLTIPKSVTKIGRKAFHLHHLSELTIPGNVKEIGESAFEGTFKAITLRKLVLEEGIETIGKYAFKEGYLESVDLPNSLKSLAPDAFYGNAGTDNDHIVILYTSSQDILKFEVNEKCQKIVFREDPGPDDPENPDDPDDPNKPGTEIKVSSITLSGLSRQIAAGKKVTLTAKVLPANATNKKLNWKSSNESVATVTQAGVVTVKPNTGGKKVTITAEAADGSGKKAAYEITSMKGAVTKVALSGVSHNIAAGKQIKLTAKVTAPAGANKKLTWKSSNTKTATVSSAGLVTIKKGTGGKSVTITASATDGSGLKAAYKITSMKGVVSKVALSGISKKIASGKKIKLTAKVTASNNANKKLSWKSSNTKAATVSSTGLVTIKKNTGGKKVTITASATDGSGRKATYIITSMKGVVKKVGISGKTSVKAGKTVKLTAKVTASKNANKAVKWTTSNKKYATVSSTGKVKAYKAGKGKKVKITAAATDGSGKKKTVTIKIK